MKKPPPKPDDIRATLDFLKSATRPHGGRTVNDLHREVIDAGLDMRRVNELEIDTLGIKETERDVFVIFDPLSFAVWAIGQAGELPYLLERVYQYRTGEIEKPIGVLTLKKCTENIARTE